jgi:hypothetical protein
MYKHVSCCYYYVCLDTGKFLWDDLSNIQYVYVVNIYLKGVQYTEPQFVGEIQRV